MSILHARLLRSSSPIKPLIFQRLTNPKAFTFFFFPKIHSSLYSICREKMALPAVFAIVPIGILFMLSGFIVNLLQAVFFIIVRPFSKCMYRRINKILAEMLWLELIWLVDWWAGLKIEVYADDKTFQLMGREHALVLCNHRSDIDWLVGWVLAQRSGCLGTSLAVMKKEALYLPILGWSMWFSDYVFLDRSWAKDETTLKSGFKQLAGFPMPFWLALFVEGTRFTEAKLQAAQEFAVTKGLPVPKNVLLPRTKGFVSAVVHMRSFVPAIYDCTLAVPKEQPAPTMLRIFRGQSSVINVQIRRHSMQELPETADGISQWCKDLFVTKDAMLERYVTMGTFSDRTHQDIGRPIKSLIVVISWSSLLLYGVIRLIQWLSFLGTWEIVSFTVTFLVLVTIMMQILMHSSESERSTPPRNLNSTVPEVKQSLLPT